MMEEASCEHSEAPAMADGGEREKRSLDLQEEELYDAFLPLSDDEDDRHHDSSSSSSSSSSDSDSDGSSYTPSPDRNSSDVFKGKAKVSNVFKKGKENKQPSSAVIEAFKDGADGKKLTVEQCRTYLRGQGLPLSGTKSILIERIVAHLNVHNGNGIPTHNGESLDLHKSFGKLQLEEKKSVIELIRDGADERQITVDMCKVYLRENCLRLTGTKHILIERIKEHIQIQNGNGILKYPEDTFTRNCQGDACVGDVVLFKQRVYDTFNLGGRCSSGPPIGVRTVAGRIIKESYGSAKQQHTFTIEVLWSTGERALPPLHPLIIKGRNLYRVKTLRQPWPDEESRMMRLQEKHCRGAAARLERKMRVEQKAARKHRGGIEERADESGQAATHVMLDDNGKKSDNNGEENLRQEDNSSGPAVSGTSDQLPLAGHGDGEASVAVLRLKSFLAGLVIGKGGKNSKEIMHLSRTVVRIEVPPDDPSVGVVRIVGSIEQIEAAVELIDAKVGCRFFSTTTGCRNGESCRFLHGRLQAQVLSPHRRNHHHPRGV